MSKKEKSSKVKFFKIDPEVKILPEFEGSISRPDVPIPESPGFVDPEKPPDNQMQLLQNYISVKEVEINDYREQKKQLDSLTKKISSELQISVQKNRELLDEIEATKKREQNLRIELRELKEKHRNELVLQKNDFEEKQKSSHELELKLEDFERNREEWKEKIKRDLNRIKLKERELENKYELLKRDTQALVDSKDKHILELSTKKDALEFEMESFEEKLRSYNAILGSIDSKKRRLIETLKIAMSLLESIDQAENSQESTRRKP